MEDSKQIKKIEVVGRDDGSFDLFVNGELDRSKISETYLPEEICVRFGFCGEEYESILQAIRSYGSAILPL